MEERARHRHSHGSFEGVERKASGKKSHTLIHYVCFSLLFVIGLGKKVIYRRRCLLGHSILHGWEVMETEQVHPQQCEAAILAQVGQESGTRSELETGIIFRTSFY